MSPGNYPLRTVQEWMKAVMTHPGGVTSGLVSDEASRAIPIALLELDQVIKPSSQMTSHDRLQVYQRAYFSRLIECLRVQFPSVHRALGDETFDAMAFGYLVETPSKSYTLATLGHAFPNFLAAMRPPTEDEAPLDFADFLIDLAKLEWAYGEVFHGSGPEIEVSLSSRELIDLSPDEFANCHLIPHESLRLMEFRFPVHEYATAIRNGSDLCIPDARVVFLVINRREYVVRRFEITREQFILLSSIIQGKTIGDALRALWEASPGKGQQLTQSVREWFQEWSRMLLFRSIRRGPSATEMR